MDKLVKARKPLRAAVTKTINEAETELAKENSDETILTTKLRKIEKLSSDLQEADQKILDALLDSQASDEDYGAEYSSIEAYNDKLDAIKSKLNDFLTPILTPRFNPQSPAASVHSAARSDGGGDKKKSYKLPKIEIKKYSGDLLEWLEFWSQFEKIHEDQDLHDSDKFHYLTQSMVPGSRAHKLVSGYPKSTENYPKVVEALQDRFGDKVLLSEVYVRNLLRLVCNKKRSSLSELHDELESHLRSLESLGIVTDQSAIFLYPMVESSLPEEIIKVWQRSSTAGYDEDGRDMPVHERLKALRKFLRQEVKGAERLSYVYAGLDEHKKEKLVSNKPKRFKYEDENIPTAAGLFSGHSSSCIFCDKSHDSRDCLKAQSMSLDEKKMKIQNKKCCFSCLKTGHASKACRAFIKCMVCQKKHLPLMCPNLHQNRIPEFTPTASSSSKSQTVATNLNCTSDVLLETVSVRVQGKRGNLTVRLIFDNGSQKSYVKKDTVQRLGYSPIGQMDLIKSLFGGNVSEGTRHNKYLLTLLSLDGKNSQEIEVLDEVTLCGRIPRVPRGPWLKELQQRNIWLNDLHSEDSEIQILVGSDYYGRLLTGRLFHLECGLTAFETVFGWTLGGKLPNITESTAMIVTSMLVHDSSITQLWDLETIGIRDPVEVVSQAEQTVIMKNEFLKNMTRSPEGRYNVRLPWIDGPLQIPNNYHVALKRLNSTTDKLKSKGRHDEYDDIFQSWKSEGMIEEVNENSAGSLVHYLPHRPVFKPQSLTTPVRPVFDASCKTGRSPSLNECLHKGPNLMELLPDILHRFREKKIGVVSDIRKAFMMIEVNEADRDVLRFLWWEDSTCQQVKIFRHCRVVFGVTCSPFMLAAVLEAHLNTVSEDKKHIIMKLLKSIYVDNCVSSVDTYHEYEDFKKQASAILAEAKMDLRLWECSHEEGAENLGPNSSSTAQNSITSVLGLKWDKSTDTLSCEIPTPEIQETLTKRKILSQYQKIFDPLGMLCPALITVKILLQRTWAQNMSWDEDVGGEIKSEFLGWWEELTELEKIRIPRCATDGSTDRNNWQIHTFCDASKNAYAAVVFLRVCENDKVSVQLLQARARVAPLQPATIPRLELISCLIGSRLTKSVHDALSAAEVPTFYWSDSTTSLAWIKRNDMWGTFVGNRVKEICQLSNSESWRHVPGIHNPADLPSRGCSPRKLLESKWWEGPAWLSQPPEEWPTEQINFDEEEIAKELKKPPKKKQNVTGTPELTSVHHIGSTPLPWYSLNSSSYRTNVRVMAWVLRFISKTRKIQSESSPQITIPEFREAEKKIWIAVQYECFPEKKETVCGLRVQRDEQLIRVKTKLIHRQDTKFFRLPILVPHSHPLVDLLIREEHVIHGHAGIQFLMSNLREKFWIVQSRRAIRKIVTSCVICRRHNTRPSKVVPSALPEDRVTTTNVFQVTGVDLAGPLYLKDKSKVYVVIYTCAVYRCVHFELVTSLSTDTFLLSLFRFISRRGRPSTVYSDNGTNFVGAVNLFKLMDWKRIEREASCHQIKWKFSPPSAPWWGGWWERLISSMKGLLKRSLGFRKLNYEQLTTSLCQAEAVMNDRPLTYVTEDQDDLIPLTPSMFLQDIRATEVPEMEALDANGLRKAYRTMKQLQEEIRGRFRSEYLGLLVQRAQEKKTHNLQVGDVVLIGSDNKKRLEWPMGRITALIPGKDDETRVAKIKTLSGEFLRPIQRLYPLEVHSSSNPEIPIREEVRLKAKQLKLITPAPEVVTRFGRKIKKPVKYEA